MICLRLLGPIELAGPDGAELRSLLAQPKRTALLAYLAVEAPRGFQRRDTLLGLFWPDFDEQRARAALSRALHFLRRGLGDAALPGRGDGELTVDASLLWCDVVAFDAARAAGDHAAALALYRGELLEGFVPDEIPEFERWLERERRRLRLAASASAAATADAREAAGDLAGAVAAARRRVALDPHDEPALRALLTLLDRSGDRAGALAAYETAARQLRDDLAVEPSAETRATADAIRAGRRSAGHAASARWRLSP
jgi:DNA-binding SARP family transcriptional activator